MSQTFKIIGGYLACNFDKLIVKLCIYFTNQIVDKGI